MRSTENDDPTTTPTALTVAIFVLLFAMTLFALQAYFGRVTKEEFDAKFMEQTPAELQALRVEQREQLSTYRWLDQERNVVAIPIDRAMKLVAREMAQSPSTPNAPSEAN
jgi:hypothetical protein